MDRQTDTWRRNIGKCISTRSYRSWELTRIYWIIAKWGMHCGMNVKHCR